MMGGTNIKQIYWCWEEQNKTQVIPPGWLFSLPFFPRNAPAPKYSKLRRVWKFLFFYGFVSRTLANKMSPVKGSDGELDFGWSWFCDKPSVYLNILLYELEIYMRQ